MGCSVILLCPLLEPGQLCISCITALQKNCVVQHVYSPVVNQECCARKVRLFKEEAVGGGKSKALKLIGAFTKCIKLGLCTDTFLLPAKLVRFAHSYPPAIILPMQ